MDEYRPSATLTMILKADSGYESRETHRINADQWERIVRIAADDSACDLAPVKERIRP